MNDNILLSCKDLHLSFGDNEVLHGINLDVKSTLSQSLRLSSSLLRQVDASSFL